MRLTLTLCRQHLGRMFKKHWKIQGNRSVLETGTEQKLAKLGITVHNIQDVLKEEVKRERVEIVGFTGGQQEVEKDPAACYEKECHVYRDHNVLLEGLEQAKLLTKTVEIEDSFPEALKTPPQIDQLPDLDELVQRYVLTSHIFDAAQDLLPIVRDPERPAWVFPRSRGIPASRSSSLLNMKFLHLCEALRGKPLGMLSVSDSFFSVPLVKDEDYLQFELTADFLLTTPDSLPPIADPEAVQEAESVPLPDLSPIKHTISLEKLESYDIKDVYPVDPEETFSNLHTAIVFYDKEKVQNLFATPVTESQILGRSLMYSFTIAAAKARHFYGITDEDLPEPITMQCIQTDGKQFYFSVFQLNTLNLNGIEGRRNLLWKLPTMSLFDSCGYVNSVPVLKGYNPQVFRTFYAFYSNGKE